MKKTNHNYSIIIIRLLLIIGISLNLPTRESDAESVANDSRRSSPYTTRVERESRGKLSDEDFRQVTLLTSRVVLHILKAIDALDSEQLKIADGELNKAQSLIYVIRDILPTTLATTIVTDSDGNKIYTDTRHIQDDLIPIFMSMTETIVIEPVLRIKKRRAKLKNIILSDADLVFTKIHVDLSYIEKRLELALNALKNAIGIEALDHLTQSIAEGIQLEYVEADRYLFTAERAMRLADRLARDGQYRSARSNLRVAEAQLELYRQSADLVDEDLIINTQKELRELSATIDKPGASRQIRNAWSRMMNRETENY